MAAVFQAVDSASEFSVPHAQKVMAADFALHVPCDDLAVRRSLGSVVADPGGIADRAAHEACKGIPPRIAVGRQFLGTNQGGGCVFAHRCPHIADSDIAGACAAGFGRSVPITAAPSIDPPTQQPTAQSKK